MKYEIDKNYELTFNNEVSWIATIWTALDELPQEYTESDQWDEVTTAMAWIQQRLGVENHTDVHPLVDMYSLPDCKVCGLIHLDDVECDQELIVCPDCNEDVDAHDLRGGDACPEKEPVSLENIVQDVDDAVWNVVVKHFPLAKSGDFDPLESGIWTESIRRAVTHWWTFNASEFYELNKDGE
jgi:hypothetical protein